MRLNPARVPVLFGLLAALLAALAVQMNTSGIGVEDHVADLDSDDFRYACASVVHQHEQGMITLAQPRAPPVRRVSPAPPHGLGSRTSDARNA